MARSLRLTCTSDCHISDWTQHSSLGPDGRPSRLTQYLTLAEDICSQAEKNKSDAIIIAGDVVENSVIRPMVIDVLNEFIDTLSDFPLYITHGQHDLDTKQTEISPYHSALSHLKNHPNVYYASTPRLYRIKDYQTLVCPWGFEELDLGPADIFVGHGFVSGSSNFEGYIFKGGFRKEDLWDRFRVSIIGDIHKAQTFERDGHLILIPGSPLQNSYRDSPVTGIWNVNLDENEVSYEFIPIQDLRPNFYHQFLFTDKPDQLSSPLVHYRYRAPKEQQVKQSAKTAVRASFQNATLLSIASQVIDQAKIENKNKIREMISISLSGLPSSDRKIPSSKVHWVKYHNFMSIGDFTLDMGEFLDNLVIVGPNGHGKTSLLEGLLWCLTGNNTRGVLVSDVVNDYADDRTASVITALEIEGSLYQISRERGPDGPDLTIGVWNPATNQFVEQNRGAPGRTQDTIYRMLGLVASEILMLSYFSAKEPVLFGTLGASDKNSVMATINGSSEVDLLRNHFSQQLTNYEKSLISARTKIDTLNKTNQHLKEEIRNLLEQDTTDSDEELNNLLVFVAESEKKLREFGYTEDHVNESLLNISHYINQLNRTKDNLEQDKSRLIERRNRVTESIASLRNQLRIAMQGQCPTCGQDVQDEALLSTLSDEISEMTSRLPSDDEIEDLSTDIRETEALLLEAIPRKAELEKDLDFVRKSNRLYQDTKDRIAELQRGRPDYGSIIQAHQKTIERNLAEISGTEAVVTEVQTDYDCSKWVHGTLLKRNGPLIQALNARTKDLLQEQIDLLTEDEDIAIRIEDDLSPSGSFLGRDFKPYKKLSLGQERIIDFAMMISLNNAFTKIFGLEEGVLGVAAFDEVLSFLDEQYMDFAYRCLEKLNVGKKIVISHDTRLVSKFDYKITVFLYGKGSSTYAKSWS